MRNQLVAALLVVTALLLGVVEAQEAGRGTAEKAAQVTERGQPAVYDDDGGRVFIAILEPDEHGRKVQRYKQEESFTPADYERVIAYYRRRARQKAHGAHGSG